MKTLLSGEILQEVNIARRMLRNIINSLATFFFRLVCEF